jgi:ADP-heptose:LPS heptosyltransferase
VRRWTQRRIAAGNPTQMLTPEDLDPPSIRKALIILPNCRMGNLLLATPIAQWLRQGLAARGAPEPVIDICSDGHFADLLAHNPHVHRHIEIPTAAHPLARRALMRTLAAEKFDLVYLATHGGKPLASHLALATRARFRIGAGSEQEGPLNLLLDPPGKDAPITERHRAVVERLGLAPDPDVDLTMISTPEEIDAARATIAAWDLGDGRRPLAVFPMGHRVKQIPFDKWAAIIDRLRADFPGLDPVVFHGPADAAKMRSLQSALGPHPVRAVAVPLRPFCALVQCAAAAVTCDSGPMHVARAKRRPIVSLFTKNNGRKFAPQGPNQVSIFRHEGPDPGEVSCALRRVLGR